MFPLLKTLFQKSIRCFVSWWIWILFFGLSLVSYPKTPQGYEIAKFIFWEVWWLVYLIWLGVSGEGKSLWEKQSASIIFGWLFILIMGITAFQGGETSFLGSTFRKQGWLFFFQLWIFFLGLRGKREKLFSSVIPGLGLSTVILVGIGIWERFSGWARVGTSFGEPNILGGYLAVVFPLLLDKTWWWSGILAVLGVYLTESRSAVVALGTVSLILLIGLRRSLKIKSILNVLLGIIIIGTLLLTWSWRDFRTSQEDNRLGVWRMAIRAGLAQPFIGYGVDNIVGILPKFASEKEIGMKGLVIDRTHSLILDLWLWSGVLGVISFFTWLVETLWHYLKEKNKDWRLISSVFGFLVFSSFNPLSIPIWVILFFVLAMMEEK